MKQFFSVSGHYTLYTLLVMQIILSNCWTVKAADASSLGSVINKTDQQLFTTLADVTWRSPPRWVTKNKWAAEKEESHSNTEQKRYRNIMTSIVITVR